MCWCFSNAEAACLRSLNASAGGGGWRDRPPRPPLLRWRLGLRTISECGGQGARGSGCLNRCIGSCGRSLWPLIGRAGCVPVPCHASAHKTIVPRTVTRGPAAATQPLFVVAGGWGLDWAVFTQPAGAAAAAATGGRAGQGRPLFATRNESQAAFLTHPPIQPQRTLPAGGRSTHARSPKPPSRVRARRKSEVT